MIDAVLAKVFGTKNKREIKAIQPTIAAINDLEPVIQQLSDIDLAAKTIEFKEKLAQGAPLDDLLIEAFAVVREAGRRFLNMRHFDVQLIGGIVLHRGKIAEMRTGEGKTLVATLPAYLNALEGKGVHIVTVNDYLAHRDADWMGKIHRALGLTVGVIVHDLDDRERQDSYNADITYGTNNEFGFDYLRDNMKFRLEDCIQRGHHYAIVDEVDSILIDEARTPLIISGPSEESTDKYFKVNRIIPKLMRGEEIEGKEPGEKYTTGDYTVDEKHRTAALTEEGFDKAARLLGLPNIYDIATIEWKHHVEQAVKAHALYLKDRDYVVKRNDETGQDEVIIVDEFTGRLMPGRRWSDGLHQAVEAKEGVKIERENQTLATITFQNYFRMYKKLAGMTGTAETEAAEFDKIYKLEVTVIPTNREMVRKEFSDVVYRTEEEKFRNAAKEIKELQEKGQPVLVGTISVEKSERLSGILKRMGVKHEVLNAKHHEREALIVAQAGRKGAITVSTNMAGRGTDILLGGNPEFMAREALRKQAVDPDQDAQRGVGSAARPLQGADRPRTRRSHRPRRPAYPGHRAARFAPHRQPVAGPRRPPGRSRQFALLSVFAGRSDAHLRRRAHAAADAAPRHGRGCADRVEAHHQAHSEGPGSRGSAEFRSAQTPARIRRRQQQAAPGDLRHAPAVAGGLGPEGAGHGHGPRPGRAVPRYTLPRAHPPGYVGSGRSENGCSQPVRVQDRNRRNSAA